MTTMESSRPARMNAKAKRRSIFIAATLASLIAYVLLIALSDRHPALAWIGIGFGLLAIGLACFWVRALDEAAQQAHYISWFWGGSLGLVASYLGAVALTPRLVSPNGLDPLIEALAPQAPVSTIAFTGGFLLGVVPAVLGYAIWWAVLWIRRG